MCSVWLGLGLWLLVLVMCLFRFELVGLVLWMIDFRLLFFFRSWLFFVGLLWLVGFCNGSMLILSARSKSVDKFL